MRVYLVGHAISPIRGSEPGNTWNWAWELSQHVPVTVLSHPQYREEVEARLKSTPNPRLRVRWVEVKGVDPWKPGKGERGLRLHYLLWLREVARELRRILDEEGRTGAIVHHVSWGTLSAPPPFTKLGVPVVWGPVGGGQKVPKAFLRYWGKERWKEVLRSWRISLLAAAPWWRRAVRQYDLVLATNRETLVLLQETGVKDVRLFLDSGVPVGFGLDAPPTEVKDSTGPLRVLWAGRLESMKTLPLALEALTQMRANVELWVAGDGPRRSAWEEMAKALGLEQRVHFLGRVPPQEMPNLFKRAQAFLFTSMRDSFGSVVLEAMAFGLPFIVPDHQGVGTFVPDDAGIKVPVTTLAETASGFARALERLALDPDLRLRLAQGAWRYAQEERWDRRAQRMLGLYEEVLSRAHRHI